MQYGPVSSDFIVGDKFLFEYSKKEPQIARIIHCKPLFGKAEKIDTTSTNYITVSPYDRTINFRYRVNGRDYTRCQEISDTVDIDLFRAARRFKLRYLVSNPERSILDF
ncbi:hypothetical protein [Desertivirga brevis]|uniref:hypothetical protein n=1 Tax=Desertivirga brevis TaxID=2810310 RepID=UPI001A95D8BD|nr:hypothetical protein [Pedobacter sp. SYSU D00873]